MSVLRGVLGTIRLSRGLAEQTAQQHLLAAATPINVVPDELKQIPSHKAPQRPPPLMQDQQHRGGYEACWNAHHVQGEICRVLVAPSPACKPFTHYSLRTARRAAPIGGALGFVLFLQVVLAGARKFEFGDRQARMTTIPHKTCKKPQMLICKVFSNMPKNKLRQSIAMQLATNASVQARPTPAAPGAQRKPL